MGFVLATAFACSKADRPSTSDAEGRSEDRGGEGANAAPPPEAPPSPDPVPFPAQREQQQVVDELDREAMDAPSDKEAEPMEGVMPAPTQASGKTVELEKSKREKKKTRKKYPEWRSDDPPHGF